MNADTVSRDARLAAGDVLDYERVDGPLCDCLDRWCPRAHWLPEDRRAEDALIGAVLKRPRLLDSLDLAPADFLRERYRPCWSALLRLHARGEHVDYEALLLELRAMGHHDAHVRLSELGGTNGLSADAGSYAERLKDMGRRRRVWQIAQALVDGAANSAVPLADVVRRGDVALADLARVVAPVAAPADPIPDLDLESL